MPRHSPNHRTLGPTPSLLFAIIMDSVMENIRKEYLGIMVFAYDVVLCAREKGVLEIEPEQWRETQEKRGETNESVKSVDGITGGRCRRGGGSYSTRGYHHTDDCSASYALRD